MAIDVGTLVMKFDADDKNLKKGFNGIENGLKNISKAAAIGAAAVGAALVVIATKSIKLAEDQEKAEARLESIAKKVTRATDEQIESLKKLAAETQKLSTFGDEVLITGQSQLLSFGLQADQVEQLTGSLADLLAANKGITATSDDAIGAANLLGKAFSGQAGALSRVGILLDDASAEVLKNGSAAQKTAELVKIMDANYGGLAETLSQTTAGQLQQAKNAIGDVGEVIGRIFLPFINDALKVVQKNLPAIQDFFTKTFGAIAKIMETGINFIIKYKEVLIPLAAGIAVLTIGIGIYNIALNATTIATTITTAATTAFGAALAFVTSPIGLVVLAIAALVVAGVALVRNWDKIKETASNVFGAIKDIIVAVFDIIKRVIDFHIQVWKDVFDVIGRVINRVKDFFGLSNSASGFSIDINEPNRNNRTISGQRAFGGNVTANDSFLVGERGPEIFTPSTNGNISTNSGNNVVIHINGATDTNTIMNEVVRVLHMQGITR